MIFCGKNGKPRKLMSMNFLILLSAKFNDCKSSPAKSFVFSVKVYDHFEIAHSVLGLEAALLTTVSDLDPPFPWWHRAWLMVGLFTLNPPSLRSMEIFGKNCFCDIHCKLYSKLLLNYYKLLYNLHRLFCMKWGKYLMLLIL